MLYKCLFLIFLRYISIINCPLLWLLWCDLFVDVAAPEPYGPDLRVTLVYQNLILGWSREFISNITGVSQSSIYRYGIRVQESGTIYTPSEINNNRAHRPSKVTTWDLLMIMEIYKEYPTLYPDEVSDILEYVGGSDLHPNTIRYWLAKIKHKRKKIWRQAKEAQIQQVYQYWLFLMNQINYFDQFIFFDESHIDSRDLDRAYGYSEVGTRPVESSHFVRGLRFTIFCAINMRGVVDYEIIQGASSGHLLFLYVLFSLGRYIQPYPRPNSVIILDNCWLHYYLPFQLIISFLGGKLLYLPPYCPFLNCVEKFFNTIKTDLKRVGDYYVQHPVETIEAIIEEHRDTNFLNDMIVAGYDCCCEMR